MNIPAHIYVGLHHHLKYPLPKLRGKYEELRQEWYAALDEKDQLEQKKKTVGLTKEESCCLKNLGVKVRKMDGFINELKTNTVNGAKIKKHETTD